MNDLPDTGRPSPSPPAGRARPPRALGIVSILGSPAILLALLVAASAAINLLYVVNLDFTEEDRLRGDAAYYHLAGKGIEEILRHPLRFSRAIIQGTLDQEELASLGLEGSYNGGLLRSPAYGLFLGWLYALFGDGPYVVPVAQALLVALMVLCVYILGREVFDRRSGLIAAALTVGYSSFVYFTGRTLTETLALVLLSLTLLFAVLTCRRAQSRWPVLAGFAAGTLLLCKISMRYFAPLLVVILIVLLRRERRPLLLRKTAGLLAGLAAVLVPWLLFAGLVYHAPLLTAPLHTGPLYTLYRGNYVPQDGWEDDGAGDAWTPEFVAASAEAAPGDFERGKVYRAAAAKTLRNHPGGTLLLLLRKISRMWDRPADAWRPSLGLASLPQQVGWHRLLVLLALLGMFRAAFARPTAILLIAPAAYLTILHGLSRVESRFAVPAMPVVILLAAGTIGWLIFERRRWFPALRRRALHRAAAVLLVSLLGAHLATAARWMQWWPALSPRAAHFAALIFPAAGLAAGAFALFLLAREELGARRARIAALLPAAVLFVICGAAAAGDPSWRQWRCRLDAPGQKAVQEIVLPGPLDPRRFEGAALQIDMLGGLSMNHTVSILVNGRTVKEYERGLEVDERKFIYPEILNPGRHTRLHDTLKATLARARELHSGRQVDWEYFRQWHRIPFDPELLRDADRVRIEVVFNGRGGRDDFVQIYGDYPVPGDPRPRRFVGPSFARTLYETSTDKLQAFAGDREQADYRLQQEERLLSSAAHACFFERGACDAADLSPAPGRQSGEYRIRLELKCRGAFYRRAAESGEERLDWRFDGEDGGQARASVDDLRKAQRWKEGMFSGYFVF